MDEKVIGSFCLCNTASLNITNIDETNETVTAGINNLKRRKYKINYTDKGSYFNFGGHRYYLHEFMRV